MLYVVATPIGNLGDLSVRAREILSSCDLIAAEDTRRTQKLLTHFQIRKPLISYYEHNKSTRGPLLLEKLRSGQNVTLLPTYTADSTSLPTPSPAKDGVPVLDLYYKLDEKNNVGSFVMAAGWPDYLDIQSVGVAFYYKDAADFDPTDFTLLLNNKMLASNFNTDSLEETYVVNIKKLSNRYNWAARGYVNYYDQNGKLQTVYSNQINLIAREQV